MPSRTADRSCAAPSATSSPTSRWSRPSEPDGLDGIAAGLTGLADLPALVLWGARDPVFTEPHLADLEQRLPRADVQRYAAAAHLVTEDVPEAAERRLALGRPRRGSPRPGSAPSASTDCPRRHCCPGEAITGRPSFSSSAAGRSGSASPSWRTGSRIAAGLQAAAYDRGDRVALLVPPGIDLTVAVYACWRAGAVIVVADAGLGLRGLARALRSAGPDT